MIYPVLAFVSKRYPSLWGRLPTCYSPVCHWAGIQIQLCASTPSSMGRSVRLACLRHAASVHPEPGSNSPKKIFLFRFCFFLAFLNWHFAQFSKIILASFSWRINNIPNPFALVKLFSTFFVSLCKTRKPKLFPWHLYLIIHLFFL